MKKAGGIIELLIAFLLISLIVGCFLQMTIIQNSHGKLQNTTLIEAKEQADEIIDDIEQIKEQNLEYEEELLNNYDE